LGVLHVVFELGSNFAQAIVFIKERSIEARGKSRF